MKRLTKSLPKNLKFKESALLSFMPRKFYIGNKFIRLGLQTTQTSTVAQSVATTNTSTTTTTAASTTPVITTQSSATTPVPGSIEASLLAGQPPGTIIKCVTAQVISTAEGPRIVLQGLQGSDFTPQQLNMVQQQVKQQLLKGWFLRIYKNAIY